jgi:hypothetical protein
MTIVSLFVPDRLRIADKRAEDGQNLRHPRGYFMRGKKS